MRLSSVRALRLLASGSVVVGTRRLAAGFIVAAAGLTGCDRGVAIRECPRTCPVEIDLGMYTLPESGTPATAAGTSFEVHVRSPCGGCPSPHPTHVRAGPVGAPEELTWSESSKAFELVRSEYVPAVDVGVLVAAQGGGDKGPLENGVGPDNGVATIPASFFPSPGEYRIQVFRSTYQSVVDGEGNRFESDLMIQPRLFVTIP